jgi:hypothetical protein
LCVRVRAVFLITLPSSSAIYFCDGFADAGWNSWSRKLLSFALEVNGVFYYIADRSNIYLDEGMIAETLTTLFGYLLILKSTIERCLVLGGRILIVGYFFSIFFYSIISASI